VVAQVDVGTETAVCSHVHVAVNVCVGS
jgi:hypothetical protein